MVGMTNVSGAQSSAVEISLELQILFISAELPVDPGFVAK
jgi:hypothetical protein